MTFGAVSEIQALSDAAVIKVGTVSGENAATLSKLPDILKKQDTRMKEDLEEIQKIINEPTISFEQAMKQLKIKIK